MQASVVIPYNKARYVRRCLESVLAQTLTDFETTVVDDSSTDGSDRIVESYLAPNIRLVRQANSGPGAARNRGLVEARGEYVAFLDADDEWLPEYLATSIHALRVTPLAAAVTSSYVEEPNTPCGRSMATTIGIDACTGRTPSVAAGRARALQLRAIGSDLSGCGRAERKPAGARSVEPFLLNPEVIRARCPRELHELLERFLATRAFKTACVLGSWGRWREARALRDALDVPRRWELPYAAPSWILSTRAGAALASVPHILFTQVRRSVRRY
jgi:hypothetical protein